MTDTDAVVAVSAPLTPEEITAVLAARGAVDEADSGHIRMKVKGNNFITDDDIWMTNIKTGAPAFTARLLAPPVQYQGFYFDAATAEKAGRPEMTKKFCKSHYDNPSEARETGTNGAPCRPCIVNPFGSSSPKCSWRGDLAFQMIPDEGEMTGDEPIFSLTLSLTGMIEWKGTRKAQNEGSVSKKNFMYKLAELSLLSAEEWGISQEQAIVTGLTALNEGLVAAEFRSLDAHNEERGMSWNVVSLTPIHVQPPDTGTEQIESGTSEAEAETKPEDFDDLPF